MKYASYSFIMFYRTFQLFNAPKVLISVPQVTIVQTSLDDIIAQANLDPIIAQALTDEVNNLYATSKCQYSTKYTRNTKLLQLLPLSFKLSKPWHNLIPLYPLMPHILSGLKYAAHANTIQKLLSGAYPEQFQNQLYYTDPYTETIGFILNDYVFNIFLQHL